MKIWVDADACPKLIKEHIYTIANRKQIPTTFVANSYLNIPHTPYLTFIQVEQGADVADSYIAENVQPEDIVITADIPLAGKIVESGALALNPRGEVYTEENISERLSIRDFMQELRDSGVQTEGPAPLGPKDKEKFANSLNKFLTGKN